MKKILFLLISVLLFSCSSKDDDPKATDFTLNVTELEMTVGETFQIEMKITNPNKDFPRGFTSDDESIVNINSDGLVTAKREGETSINVDYGNISKRVKVRVKARKQTLEEYYNQYCYGLRVKDTTDLKILSSEPSELNNSVYFAGLRNNKLWIGKFDKQTKEQIKEFLDVEDFELSKKIDVGYGKSEDLKIEKIDFRSIFEKENGWIAHIALYSKKERYDNHYDLFMFNEGITSKKYFNAVYNASSFDLKPWYKDSYIAAINVNDVTHNEWLCTCFNSKGEVLATTNHNVFFFNAFPTNYDSFFDISEGSDRDESDNYKEHKSVRILYYKFSPDRYSRPDFSDIFFYTSASGERDFIFDYEYLTCENNRLTFKINITFKSGAKESHIYEFNTKELTIKEI